MKQTADKWFSKYIRLRDCLRTTGTRTHGVCCTCGKIVPFAGGDCGHFISRDRLSLRYCEENAHFQCRECNRFRSGNQAVHMLHVNELHGAGTAENLLAQEILEKSNPYKYKKTKADYKAIADYYRKKFRELT